MSDVLAQYRASAVIVAAEVAKLAAAAGVSIPVAHMALVAETKKELGDGRSTKWRARVRLYSSTDNYQEPLADSDPDLAVDAPGTEICTGLAGVADFLAQLAQLYHNGQCKGLDTATLDHRLKSLRPTISRRGGNAVWRVPYTTLEHIGNVETTRDWLARVDVERVTE